MMGKAKERDISHVNENSGRKLIFRIATSGPCPYQFWVNRQLMCHKSKVIREACEKNPKRSEFEIIGDFGFANVFQSVVNYVHDGVVPIGPGGVVRWFSNEAKLYVDHMLRLYRFALKYEMEDLADRTMDELQAHEHRCGGYLTIDQIYEAYQTSCEGSKLRWYCATSVYQFATTRELGPVERPYCCNFMAMRETFPELVIDIHRAAEVYERKKGKVDYRDRSTFGTCDFHTHKLGVLCAATDPEFAKLRSRGDTPSKLGVPLKDRHGLDDDDEMEDLSPDAEAPKASAQLGNAGKAAIETAAKSTSPGLEDSGLSVAEETGIVQGARGSSAVFKPNYNAHIGGTEAQKCKKSPLASAKPSCKHDEATEADAILSLHRQIQAGVAASEKFELEAEDRDRNPPANNHIVSTDQRRKTSIDPKPKRSRKVLKSSLKPIPCEIKCRACDAEFPRKQDFLEHLARKKGDRNHRMGGRSFSLSLDGNFVPCAKRVRFDL